jgi:epsilon-lactone hydrolase
MASREHDELVNRMTAVRDGPAAVLPVEELLAAQSQEVPPRELIAPQGTTVELADMDGVTGYWVVPTVGAGKQVIMYFHGGGYLFWDGDGVWTTARGCLETMGALARTTHARVLGVEYGLAPKFPFPVPVKDAVTSYRWLLSTGVPASSVVVAGDSAGGGLVVLALVALRDAGVEMPAAGAPMSPWTDLAVTGRSVDAVDDPFVTRESLKAMARVYLAGASPEDPAASPLYAELAGLPPLLIQVGERESLLDDARRLADRARAAGVEVDLVVHPGTVHMWTALDPTLPESIKAFALISDALTARTSRVAKN